MPRMKPTDLILRGYMYRAGEAVWYGVVLDFNLARKRKAPRRFGASWPK